MSPQRRLISERFITTATLERFSSMRHQMSAQTRCMTKHLRTQGAIVQLYIRGGCIQMCAQVYTQRFLLCESLRTVRTVVWFLASVSHQMSEKKNKELILERLLYNNVLAPSIGVPRR